MPLELGKKNVGKNIAELHGGKTYAKMKKKHGKGKANKQAVAIALKKARESGGVPAPIGRY